MKYVATILLALLIPVAALAADAGTQKAIDAAKSWIALVDAKDYAQSWKTAATLLQSHVTEAQWETAAKAARDPMGPAIARNVASADFTGTLPGAPDGRYAVIRFDTKLRTKLRPSRQSPWRWKAAIGKPLAIMCGEIFAIMP